MQKPKELILFRKRKSKKNVSVPVEAKAKGYSDLQIYPETLLDETHNAIDIVYKKRR